MILGAFLYASLGYLAGLDMVCITKGYIITFFLSPIYGITID